MAVCSALGTRSCPLGSRRWIFGLTEGGWPLFWYPYEQNTTQNLATVPPKQCCIAEVCLHRQAELL